MKMPAHSRPPRAAFTLVELLVSTAIIALIMLVLLGMTNQTTQTWQYTSEKIEKFQEARDGFESMTRRISQATLNTYWDYLDAAGNPRPTDVLSTAYANFVPASYGRRSELRFISGPMLGSDTIVTGPNGNWPTHGIFFQAPLGVVDDPANAPLNNLLNTWGYFVEVDYDADRPAFINQSVSPQRWRSRLMEFMQPTEKMALFDTAYDDTKTNWFSVPLKISSTSTSPRRPVRPLAENVIALIILPKLSRQDEANRGPSAPPLCPKYIYDSTKTANPGNSSGDGEINPKNQLPPIVQVTMVAIDERSAARLIEMGSSKTPDFIGPNTSGMFRSNSKTFDAPTGDLRQYETLLTDPSKNNGVIPTYRIFTTNVSIRGAKWSRAQTK